MANGRPLAPAAARNARFQSDAGTNSRSSTGRNFGAISMDDSIANLTCVRWRRPRILPLMYLGIDIGTGGTRALLVDESGKVRAGCTSVHEDMMMARPL